MATKRVIIPNSELIPVDANNQYLVRFRVLSDDRNRFSEWSPIFSIAGAGVPVLSEARVASFMVGSVVNIIWEGLPAGSEFDIFVGYDGDQPSYHGTTSESRYLFINSAEENYRFAIQVSSISKTYDQFLQIFESELIDVV
jgi:hypothetical protein